jgi:hypothetical protein
MVHPHSMQNSHRSLKVMQKLVGLKILPKFLVEDKEDAVGQVNYLLFNSQIMFGTKLEKKSYE